MDNRKTVSELFRQSAEAGREIPSERVWERVAGRLDQQAQPPKRLAFILRTAAAVVLLGVVVWGGSNLSRQQPLTASPVALEDITPSVASVSVVMEQVALSRHYQQLPGIHEGDALQRIVPRVVLQ
jgi:hypothetical protein